MAQKTTLKEFEDVFPKLQEVLLEHAKTYNLPQEQLDWYKKVGSPYHISRLMKRSRKLTISTSSYRVWKSTQSEGNATAACQCQTRCLFSSAAPFRRMSTFTLRLWGG